MKNISISHKLFLLSALLLLLLLPAISGCGKSDSASGDDSASGNAADSGNGADAADIEAASAETVSSGSAGPVNITLHFPYGDVNGTYDGQMNANGMPDGDGMFTAHDEDGTKWTIRGEYADGLPNGECVCSWEDYNEFYGTYTDGLKEGSGRWLFSGDVLYTGIWSGDRCVDIDRPLAGTYNPDDVQQVQWGDRGFMIPTAWQCEIKDDTSAVITTDNGTSILLSKLTGKKLSNQSVRDAIDTNYNERGASLGTPSVKSSDFDSSSMVYTTEVDYDNAENVYPVELFGLAFQKGRDVFVVTTIDKEIPDYSEDAKCIYDTFTTWSLLNKGSSDTASPYETITPIEVYGTKNGKDITISPQ